MTPSERIQAGDVSAIVISTSETGVVVNVDGKDNWLAWEDLHAAARQADPGCSADEITRALASFYGGILAEATRIAANGPVVVSVGIDHTNVWHVCNVTALHGGGPANYSRRRDEGGTHPNHLLAACEAADICDRLGDRVARRVNFDGPAARAKVAAIRNRMGNNSPARQ